MRRVTLLTLLIAVTTASHASILVNGGFELPGNNVWADYHNGEVPGWHTGPNDVMEIGVGVVYGVTGFQGKNMIELDSNRNVVVSQDVNLTAGQYDLSFLYARRGTNLGNRPNDTCDFDVLWNGGVVAAYTPTTSTMTLDHRSVTAVNGNNTLSFRAKGTSDSLGAIIDGADLQAVPEPASFVAIGLALMTGLRKRRKSR